MVAKHEVGVGWSLQLVEGCLIKVRQVLLRIDMFIWTSLHAMESLQKSQKKLFAYINE